MYIKENTGHNIYEVIYMSRLKWPVRFSSIIKWIKDKLNLLGSSSFLKQVKTVPKTLILGVVLITLLVGLNSAFWWYRATHGGFKFGGEASKEPINEWNIDMNQQVLNEDELRKEYSLKADSNTIQEQDEKSDEHIEEVKVITEEPPIEQENSQRSANQDTVAEQKLEESTSVPTLATMAMPTMGKVITTFAMDTLIYSKTLEQWNAHKGIDIAADIGLPVKAAMGGKVTEVKSNDPQLGVVVMIDHGGGIKSIYGNLQSDKLIKKGEQVTKGQVIGAVGNTAPYEIEDPPHLHFELIKDGININPLQYLPQI
jgi:murein DD-endopeptidase MepM/ murein hydrolase activator NlpD